MRDKVGQETPPGTSGHYVASLGRGLPARLALGACVLACLSLLAALGAATQANAQTNAEYSHIGEYGDKGSANGEFAGDPDSDPALRENTPGRVAVHEASGKILIADTGNDRIQAFDPTLDSATFAFSFQDLDGGGTLQAPIGVAIDQATSQAYVATAGSSGALYRFDPLGDPSDPTGYEHDPTFTSPSEPASFGAHSGDGFSNLGAVAVDPTTSDVLLLDPTDDLVWRFDSDGNLQDSYDGSGSPQGAFAELWDMAVKPSGEILVTDRIGSEQIRILRLASDGTYLETFSPQPPQPQGVDAFIGAMLTVDPSSGDVLVTSKEGFNDPVIVFHYAYDSDLDEHVKVDEVTATAPGLEDRFDGAVYGMAVRGTDQRLDAIASEDLSNPTPRVQVFVQAVPPEASIDPVDPATVADQQATFTGEVDHGNAETDWRFEYGPQGTDPSTWDRTPVSDGQLDGSEATPFAVDADAQSLEPNTDYEVHLRAQNLAGVDFSATESFLTDPVAPVAETGEAWSVTATSATLAATVNPRNSETEYFFQWGPDESYGNVTEAKSAGSGGQAVEATAEISGLDPTETYHFRVIAENVEFPAQSLSDTGEDSSFTTRPAEESELPERGYELVSHVDNRGIVARGIRASASGESYVTWSRIPSTGAENLTSTLQRFTRNPDGSWSADPHMPAAPLDPTPGVFDGGLGIRRLYSEDLSLATFSTEGSYHPMDQNREQVRTGRDIYRRSTQTGEMTWLSREPGMEGEQTDPADVVENSYLSPDGSLSIFESERSLADSHDPATGSALYKWHSGDLTHVSIDPDGDNVSGADVGSGRLAGDAVSPEGDRIVFSGGDPDLIYVRIDDDRTVEVGGGDDPDLGQDATYFGADAQTTEIAYTRNGSLYLYDVASEASTEIASPVDGVFAVSDDANRIYFSSPDELTPEAEGADRYLYLAERDGGAGQELRLVSALHPLDPGIRPKAPQASTQAQADSEGELLAFHSQADLVPGRRAGGTAQVYIYEAGADRLYCASCPPDGSSPDGVGLIGANSGTTGAGGVWRLNTIASAQMRPFRNVTASGSVFFHSVSQLAPGDSNEGNDTYEWRGGEIQLISSGTGESSQQYFADASADGEAVFFESRTNLVPEAGGVSGVPRVYAARVDGGFVPPERDVACEGDECRGAAHAPEDVSPATEQGEVPRSGAPADRSALRRCVRLARRTVALYRRAVVLRKVARRSDDAQRRRASAKRFRRVARRTIVLRRATVRCRRALR